MRKRRQGDGVFLLPGFSYITGMIDMLSLQQIVISYICEIIYVLIVF